jgi:hypothetical protein
VGTWQQGARVRGEDIVFADSDEDFADLHLLDERVRALGRDAIGWSIHDSDGVYVVGTDFRVMINRSRFDDTYGSPPPDEVHALPDAAREVVAREWVFGEEGLHALLVALGLHEPPPPRPLGHPFAHQDSFEEELLGDRLTIPRRWYAVAGDGWYALLVLRHFEGDDPDEDDIVGFGVKRGETMREVGVAWMDLDEARAGIAGSTAWNSVGSAKCRAAFRLVSCPRRSGFGTSSRTAPRESWAAAKSGDGEARSARAARRATGAKRARWGSS